MKITINMQPRFYLLLDLMTVETLILMARSHYDGTCKAAGFDRAEPRATGRDFGPTPASGFLIGWRNICRNNGQVWDERDGPFEPLACGADPHQLQLVLKICEPLHSALSFKQIAPERGQALNDLCALILTAMGRVPQVPNTEVDKPTVPWALSPGRY